MPAPIAIAAGALAKWAAKKAAGYVAKKAAKYAAKKSAQRLVKKMIDQATKKGKKKFADALAKKRKTCPKCKPTDKLCKEAFGGQKSVTPGRYRGGAHGSLGATSGKGPPPPGFKDHIERHHMPANSVTSNSTGRGPAIQMDAKDHALTGSYKSSTSAKNYRKEQGLLLANKQFVAAMAMDIFQIKAMFGSKYDQAIKEAIAYTACLDAVKLARRKKK
ncbi:MAG: hypothetical protein ACSHXH_01275 [Marivita sp.]|uniref:hypothetical protein n=1 Tax=Marivita sp. TaxID=2003365 RepID=UPI003EF5425F